MNLSFYISEFILDQRIRGNSEATISYYSTSLELFKRFVNDVNVDQISLQLCKEYYLKLCDSDINSISAQSYIRALRAFLKWLYVNKYIQVNICESFKLPKATKKVIDVLTEDEINLIFSSIKGQKWVRIRNRLILALMLDSGLRLNEVITLTVGAVHLHERYIIVQQGKGNKQRIVPFGKFTASLLEDYFIATSFYIVREPLLIKEAASGNGWEPITGCLIKNLFTKLKKRTGIKRLKPHLLRHTFATRYLENGGNIYSLQAILGHSSLEMVKRYLHLANSRIMRDFPKFSPLDNI